MGERRPLARRVGHRRRTNRDRARRRRRHRFGPDMAGQGGRTPPMVGFSPVALSPCRPDAEFTDADRGLACQICAVHGGRARRSPTATPRYDRLVRPSFTGRHGTTTTLASSAGSQSRVALRRGRFGRNWDGVVVASIWRGRLSPSAVQRTTTPMRALGPAEIDRCSPPPTAS